VEGGGDAPRGNRVVTLQRIADEPPFDVAAFLAKPLVARVATAGPTARPVWFLWEEGSNDLSYTPAGAAG
jgi:hypothetical protein